MTYFLLYNLFVTIEILFKININSLGLFFTFIISPIFASVLITVSKFIQDNVRVPTSMRE